MMIADNGKYPSNLKSLNLSCNCIKTLHITEQLSSCLDVNLSYNKIKKTQRVISMEHFDSFGFTFDVARNEL
ncbi:uncharacterized protein ASCRUDRAFT_14912 [Ascoidea rubescens DSM 1968]|uniref:Outer arm dynein light chain 1 n=1 Tax=Ascoidea rubescens DSM 1968 TaxID=1344418 RepID=A0A1D2VBW6_9ASCO|nr:hypothetical protein ASCRUDRAFT_14912 [Ascoidea rubescens DSM 1968]ODV59126.1 hypothetical protein ASCRUDRAFT_14912 [Ascoidea rubescens DSM 1968]